MFAVIAAVLFGVAAILSGSGSHTSAWLAPMTLLLFGLASLALHAAGVGSGFRITRQ